MLNILFITITWFNLKIIVIFETLAFLNFGNTFFLCVKIEIVEERIVFKNNWKSFVKKYEKNKS